MIWRNIFSVRVIFSFFHTVHCENYRNVHSNFLAKISWKQRFYYNIRTTKKLIWRNIFCVRVNFAFFQTAARQILSQKKNSWNQFSNFLLKIIAFTKILTKECKKEWVNFSVRWIWRNSIVTFSEFYCRSISRNILCETQFFLFSHWVHSLKKGVIQSRGKNFVKSSLKGR